MASTLLTVRWRDRSFVLRPAEVEELARRLGDADFADLAASIRGAGLEKTLDDEEREAVCGVLTEAESDPAFRRAFTLLCGR